MLEGTAAKTRDGSACGTHAVAQQRASLSTSTEARGTGVTEPVGHTQLESLEASSQTATVPRDPRLGWTRALAVFSY